MFMCIFGSRAFSKEGVKSGTLARGGYTDVCAMPNLNPPPDTPEHLGEELSAIRRDAAVRVHPYGCITMGQRGRGELCDFEALRPQTGPFSDDGRGIQEEGSMREAMPCEGRGRPDCRTLRR